MKKFPVLIFDDQVTSPVTDFVKAGDKRAAIRKPGMPGSYHPKHAYYFENNRYVPVIITLNPKPFVETICRRAGYKIVDLRGSTSQDRFRMRDALRTSLRSAKERN